MDTFWFSTENGAPMTKRAQMAQSEPQKLRAMIEVLAQFGAEATLTEDLDTILNHATRRVSQALAIDLVKVLELLPDGQSMLVRAGVNWKPGVVGHATMAAHTGSPGGYALQQDYAVISSDVASETRFKIPDLLVDHGVKSMVNVVIRGEGEPFGVLEVDAREQRTFDQDDINFLQNYANLLAAAIDRIEAHRQLSDEARRADILARELQHRVKNLLANIAALAQRLSVRCATLDEFMSAFHDRLQAIGRVQDLLIAARQAISIGDLIQQELTAYGAAGRASVSGPEIRLSRERTQALSLGIHELITNASKHGALATQAGRIAVSWAIEGPDDEPVVAIRWREHGADIKGPPDKKGFGFEVIERHLPYMLGGRAKIAFQPSGIDCDIEFPLPAEPPVAPEDEPPNET